jgi:serine/threonine protein kinase
MSFTTGTRIGPYEITSPLGEGGMGVVYRAHDTKLGRDVAIKALPDAFANDSDRLQRFQREAQVLASLNHPNIAQIYGLEESEKTRCIVMELVEGETLQERLRRGPIPIEAALTIATQIAKALEAAHQRGIIHRDVKPANVKVLPNGTVKVLDFGLAKTDDADRARANLSNSPTLLSLAPTNAGFILGTAAYMSPEQARGENVDHRSDIFSFGCVLYEMLTGSQAFDGKTVSDVLASVLAREPDASRLPANLLPRLRKLLARCLMKETSERWQAIGDVRYELQDSATERLDSALTTVGRRERTRLPWITAAVATLAFTSITVFYVRQKPLTDLREMRVEINTPPTSAPLEFALSPDGRYIAFVASGGGTQRLWLRPLDKTDAQPLTGTEDADYPFWSPDSRSIGFVAAGKLKRTDIAGGSPQVLANTSSQFGGAWNTDGTILFSSIRCGLLRVGASGGNPVEVTKLSSTAVQHRYPHFLPDSRHFLFYVIAGTPEANGIYLASLDGGEPKRLTAADTAGLYLAPEMVLFGRGTALVAQHLDLKRGELTGEPVRVGDFVAPSALGLAGLSVSSNGVIAYRGGAETRALKWYDRSGKATGLAGEPDTALPVYPEISPDGRQLAVSRTIQGNQDIWLVDLIRGGLTRFTFDSAIDSAPVWSPDGMRIALASNRKDTYQLYVKSSRGAASEELVLETPNQKLPQDWSKDGRFLLYSEIDVKNGRDLLALPVTGSNRQPIAIARTPFDEQNGQFSPDGHFVAYQTNESGEFQIVVQSFPEPAGKWQVSTSGGTDPRWRADGKELYFIAPGGKMMAASVTAQGSTFAAATPVGLFPASPVTGLGFNKQEYTVSRDGRFLINQPVDLSTTPPITLILNWHPPKP